MSGIYAKGRIVRASVIVLLILLCAFVLSACNSESANRQITETERSLYQSGIEYDLDTMTMRVTVGFGGSAESKLNTKAERVSEKYAPDSMYKCEDVTITVDASSLYYELEGRIADEQRIHEGVKYNDLKIILRYDTIYKSIKSDANVIKSGNKYLHIFDIDETQAEQRFVLYLKNHNSAGWYTVLIASVLILGVMVIAITVAVKGKLWQKKRKQSE